MSADKGERRGGPARRRGRDGAAGSEGRQARLRAIERLPANAFAHEPDPEAVVHCGWGRLIFAQTFADMASVVSELKRERPDERDIAFYVTEPHVALALAPQEVFLDPSHSYRLWLSQYRPAVDRAPGLIVRRVQDRTDAAAVNVIYAKQHMVPVPAEFLVKNKGSRQLVVAAAVDSASGAVVGTAMGVDHVHAFNDPDEGASVWCVAVEPQASAPGIGESLVRWLAEYFQARGRRFLDLSVMHDNTGAIRLYDKLGFQRLPVFALKHKNPINERLFMGEPPEARLNPYAQIIINEARRRGIGVEVEDEDAALFRLFHGGRTVSCRESLTDLTTSVAMTRCDDKALTRRLLAKAGLSVPDQAVAGEAESDRAFLKRHGRIVVKPARGEQGRGISVDMRTESELERAVGRARQVADVVLLEQYVEGQDLRIVVIDYAVVAAAIRRPASVVGNGKATVEQLIQFQSRRRAAATGGESTIPLDEETERCVRAEGWEMDSVLPAGQALAVRKTANLHTGGTIHDVTAALHPVLADAAVRGARALEIPVVGFDFLVSDPADPDYVVIEANERPGLANHEPQPTAERFIDLLFPQSCA